jgi:hypothetical protein
MESSPDAKNVRLADLLTPDRRTPLERLNDALIASLRREVSQLEAEVERVKGASDAD